MRAWSVKVLSLLSPGRRRRARQFEDELRFHRDALVAGHVARGLTAEAAATAANRDLGGLEHTRQAWRDAGSWLPLDELLQDVRYALRVVRRTPATTGAIVLMLALAIAASTLVFAVVDAVLLAPLPYANPDRLVVVYERYMSASGSQAAAAPGTFMEWVDRSQAFTAMTAIDLRKLNLTEAGDPQQITTAAVSSGFAATVGVAPAIGRTFDTNAFQPGRDDVVLLGHGLWVSRFGGSNSVVGRSVTLNGRRYTVIGVMPERFVFPVPTAEAWLPMPMTSAERAIRGSHSLDVIARMRDGETIATAQRDLQAVAATLRRDFPATNREWDVILAPARAAFVGDTSGVLVVLLGAAGLLCLVACANAAGLLLSKVLDRRRELAIRTAMGADRRRVLQQLLTEAVVVAVAAGLAGAYLAWVGQPILERFRPADFPAWKPIAIDGRALAVSALLAMLSAIGFGSLPAAIVARANIAHLASDRTAGSAASRLRSLLVGLEIGLVVLLGGVAATLIGSLSRLAAISTGIQAERAVAIAVSLPQERYQDGTRVVAFHHDVLERIRAVPGVRDAGATSALPFTDESAVRPFRVDGLPPDAQPPEIAHYRIVTPGYFAAMGIPVRAGRSFIDADGAGRPLAVIVNDAMRRRVWRDANPIGATITFGGSPSLSAQVVGVVGDVRHFGVASDVPVEMYWPSAQIDATANAALLRMRRNLTFVVASDGDPLSNVPAVRAIVGGTDPDLPIASVRSMSGLVDRSLWMSRATAWVVTLFGLGAAVFALIGVFAASAYIVAQRRRESALRIALGATPGSVARLVVVRAISAAGLGAMLGAASAYAVSRAVASKIPGVEPSHALTLIAVTAAVLVITLLACWIPARRGGALNPMQVLRLE